MEKPIERTAMDEKWEGVSSRDVARLIQMRQFAAWLAFERSDAELFGAVFRGDDARILACFEKEQMQAPQTGARMFEGILGDIGLSPLHIGSASQMWEELCKFAKSNVDLGRQISTSDLLGIWSSRENSVQ